MSLSSQYSLPSICVSPAARVLARATLVCAAFFMSACSPPAPRDVSSEQRGADWNEGAIAWRAYDEGLAEAKATGKPVVLVFYTDWCPHCHNYSRVFHDPEVVKAASEFVMIRVNRDVSPELSEHYDLDGQYVPRTFILRPDGEVRAELTGEDPEYRYYLNEHDPRELLAVMQKARAAGAGGTSAPH